MAKATIFRTNIKCQIEKSELAQPKLDQPNFWQSGAVAVAQLVEGSLPILEIRSLNPAMGAFLSTNYTIEKTK